MNVTGEITYRSLLSEKQYLKLLFATLISRFGDSIDTLAYSWMVYQLTGSASLIASLFAINALPNLVFGMISGVVSNYFHKKKILIICDLGRGLIALITAILYIKGQLNMIELYAFTFMNSTFESIRQPAALVLYKHTVNHHKITHAKSLDNSLKKGVEMVGYGVAGILIALIGIGGVIIIDALTFFICLFIISTLVVKDEYTQKDKLTINQSIKELREGFSYMAQVPIILQMTLFATFFNLMVVPINALQAIYIGDVLKGDTYMMSLFNICILMGVIMGGLLLPILKKRLSGKTLFLMAGILIGLSYMGLSFIHLITYTIIQKICLSLLTFIMGSAIPLINMQLGILLMTKVDKRYLSRVGANVNTFGLCATPLGAFLAGSMTSNISITGLYRICSLILLVFVIGQIRNKTLNEL